MAEILGAATSATKFFLEVNQVSIDNWTFKLYYKATVTILLACSVVATSKQFFGDPINCEITGGDVNDAVLNSYCWMYATFNIPLNFRGVCSKREHDGSTLYNSYYQWVSIFLVVTAMFFYMPRAIWLMVEGGLMKFLAKGTTTKIVENADEKRENLIKTFAEHLHNKYNRYAMGFFVCEQMNFLIVLCSWFITNKFLHYKFITYGPEVVRYYNIPAEERRMVVENPNPMCETFPRIAACVYHRFGTGGGPEQKSAICILGLNMINDKVFLVLWFWYFALTVFGAMRFIYRITQLSSRTCRYYVMKMRIYRYFKSDINMLHVKWYVTHCSIGDWFVLYQMSRNMNTRFFAEFITVLSRKVNPCPNVTNSMKKRYNEEEDDADSCCKYPNTLSLLSPPNANGGCNLPRAVSEISLHNKILDITFDAEDGEEEEETKEEKKKEEPKKEKDDDDEKKEEEAANTNGESSKCKPRNLAKVSEDDDDDDDIADDLALGKWAYISSSSNNRKEPNRMGQQPQQQHQHHYSPTKHGGGGGGHKTKRM